MSEPIRCSSTTRPVGPPYGTRVVEEDTGLIQEYRNGAYHSGWHVVSTTDSLCPAPYRALLAATNGVVREVVTLHRPEPQHVAADGMVTWWRCEGCDADGYEWEHPEWPCRTSQLVAERLAVILNERHYAVDSAPA